MSQNPSDKLAAAGKRSLDMPYLALVRRADPDFEKNKRSEIEYEFGGGRVRKTANPTQRGAYKPST